MTLGKLAPKWAKEDPYELGNLRNINRRSYLGGLGREYGFGKLTPPKVIEVLRNLTRESMSAALDGSSLPGA